MRFLLAILLTLSLASPSWATITFGTAGATASGTSSLTVAYPATVIAGDLLVMCVGNKYPPNGPTTPSGWTAVTNGQASGGQDPDSGGDTGHVYSTLYVKLADGTETGNVTVTITSGNSSQAEIFRYRNETGAWTYAASNGPMNTPSTSWSVTAAADPGVTVNDYVLTCTGKSVDTVNMSAQTITQTGMTFAAVTERLDNTSNTNGDDMSIVFTEHSVTVGTSVDAPVFAGTMSAAAGGSTAFLRIRETASTPIAFGTIGAAGSGTTSATAAMPASIAAGDLLLACIAHKYPAGTLGTPTDTSGVGAWALVTNGQQSGGADPDGASTGHAVASIYYKVSPSGTESGNLSIAVSSGNSISSSVARYTKADPTATWGLSATNGSDNTADTTWSVTGAADNDVQVGDLVVTCSATADDLGFTVEALTQTGVVYGTFVERFDNGTSLGDDVGSKIVEFSPVTGPSSAAPVFTATNGASVGGATVFLRLRQVAAVAASPLPSSQGFLGVIFK